MLPGSLLPILAGLGLPALIALYLTLTRRPVSHPGQGLVRAGALTVLVQAAHFTEELSTGFYVRFPALLGQPPWPESFFFAFNMAWLVVWALSLPLACRPVRAAFFPLWFLGLAAVGNGLAHPAFALLSGGYFPGLWTALPAGIAGFFLLRHLRYSTR